MMDDIPEEAFYPERTVDFGDGHVLTCKYAIISDWVTEELKEPLVLYERPKNIDHLLTAPIRVSERPGEGPRYFDPEAYGEFGGSDLLRGPSYKRIRDNEKLGDLQDFENRRATKGSV